MTLPALLGDRWQFVGQIPVGADTIIYSEPFIRGTNIGGVSIHIDFTGSAKVETYQRSLIAVGLYILPVAGTDAATTPEEWNKGGSASFANTVINRLNVMIPKVWDNVASGVTGDNRASEQEWNLAEEDVSLLYDPARLSLKGMVRSSVGKRLWGKIYKLGEPNSVRWDATLAGYVYNLQDDIMIPSIISSDMDFDIALAVTQPLGVQSSEVAGTARDDDEYEIDDYYPANNKYTELGFLAPMYDSAGGYAGPTGVFDRGDERDWLLRFLVDKGAENTQGIQFRQVPLWTNSNAKVLVIRRPVTPKILSPGNA